MADGGQTLSILAAATLELRRVIQATAVRETLASGAVLFFQGEPGDAFFEIERGEIEISTHAADGRKLVLDILRAGEVFGEIALFGGTRTATATALDTSVVRRMRRTDVMERLRTRPELALDFIELLCDRLRRVSAKLEERAFLPVPTRLASRLLYLDGKFGGNGRVTVSQNDLANLVGATREGVSKVLAIWRARNWVALSRGVVEIRDRAELLRISEEFRG